MGKKKLYGQYTQAKVDTAIGMLKAGQISLRKASAYYGIPKSTLQVLIG